MSIGHSKSIIAKLGLLLLTLILMVSCGTVEPPATPLPAAATRIALEPAHTPLPPTATPAPPTPPPTATPTATAVPIAPTPMAAPLALLTGRGGGVIAFTSDRDGNDEIYVMNADGSGQRNLTHHPASDTDPAWSPDGMQIAFSSDRDGDYEVYVMSIDGGNLRQLTDNPAVDAGPVWLPDGSKVAFVSLRDGNTEIYSVNVDGSDLQRLTDNDYDDWEIDWSPDGSRIAVAAQPGEYTNIYLLGPDGGDRQQLTDTNAHDLYPRWSPSGTRIAFLSQRDGGLEEIYLMDADGSNQKRLTNNDAFDGAPSWSPDGTRFVFASDRDGDNEIYVMSVPQEAAGDGPDVQRLTDNDAVDRKPAWQPPTAPVAFIVSQLEGLPPDRFLQESFQYLQLRDPDVLFTLGLADLYGVVPGEQFTDLSIDYVRETQQLEREILDLLRTYDRNALSAEQQISYDALEWVLTMQVRGQAFTGYRFLVNPVWGLQNWPLDFLQELPLKSKQDAENYIARLSNVDIWVDQVIAGLELNEQVGAVPPRYVLEDTIDQLDGILVIRGGNPPLADQIEAYTNFSRKAARIEDLDEDERQALLDSALQTVEEVFIPAYQALKEHLVYLTTIAISDPDEWKLPGGEEYYAYLLQYYTGTDLSAEELHALGLAEVARIQADMRSVAVDMGYPAEMSMAELSQVLADESRMITGETLRWKYNDILTAADQAAETYFDLRTSADVVIRPVSSGPPAYYQPPRPGSSGPGVMPVNLDVSPLYVNYNELVLVHHETIPGHHTQIALAQELDLPWYQRFDRVNPYLQDYQLQAYTEGWALYAEILGWEMGLYEGEPLANLGRLRLRLLRAVRMVADTGLHAKGWTLKKAAAYLKEATGMAQSNAQLTRYLVNPGYPCGYNIGGLKILELRQRARDQLGDRFDIKEFHNTVLGHGILPIGVLEDVVNDWIEQKRANGPTPTSEATSDGPSIADVLAGLQGLPFDEYLESSYRQLQLRDPDQLFVNGLAAEYGVANDHFTDMSAAYLHQTQQLEVAILDQLRTYDRSALTPDQQVSYDVYEWLLDDRVRGHRFAYHDYPVNPLTIWGKQNWLIDFLVHYQPITGQQAAEDYVARLSQIDTWVEQLLEGLKLREQAGIVPPRYVIEETISQVEGHLQMFDVEAIQLYTSFREKLDQVDEIGADQKQILLDAALAEIEDTFIPAFLALRDYLVYLETVADQKSGVWKLPDGEAYYAYILRHQTGTDLSPDQVHELGLAEVARLQAEIQAAAAELGYPADIGMAELEEHLAVQNDHVRGAALLAEYKRLIAAVEEVVDSFFDLPPIPELAIEPEPFGSGIGYYLPPPLSGSGPGTFYTNLSNPIPRHVIPSFIFHETVPGHHLQGALARGLDLPTFRRTLDLNGYVEGWAVYAERLAWEMGLYEDDPLGNLGRLQFELSRAARQVIDTGLHAKGWSRQEAADYYEEATGRPTSPAAMNRYVILPGQGCGYTLGLLKILESRQLAMDQLGDRFDIKAFHNIVLGNGSLPLDILEQVVQNYIDAESAMQ